MAWKRMVMELGMGTDIRGSDYTKAAMRAVHNALRQNSLVIADAFGKPREEMRVDIHIGVQKPENVDRQEVASVLPYGSGSVEVVKGGMDTPKDDGTPGTIMANAALIVYLDLPENEEWVKK
ncbi:MAG: Lin0512 family protein [Pseudomonadota bacterium]